MESDIELLIQLQKIDLQIQENTEKEKTISSRLSEIEKNFELMQKDFLNRKEDLKNTRKEKMEKELRIKEIDEKLQKHEEEKYRIKSKDEFEALEKEIASLEKQKEKEEDELLEIMEKEEELTQLIPSLEKEISAEREKLIKEKESLIKQLSILKKKKGSLLEEREKISPRINKVYYTQYEQLRRTRGNLAVALVENGICKGCNVKVSPSLVGQMRRSMIVYCENCSRILYVDSRSGK